ncbi:hypothetical protein F3157_22245 [Virgibacillus dakarensis]|nr:hypothetical protein [Virgibacillus dakarensis]
MNFNPYQQPFTEGDERQQFNFPGFFGEGGQQGFPGGNQFSFPGFPEFPGGGQSGGPGTGQSQFPGGPSASAPTSPPPSFTPEQPQFQTFAVDPGAIRGCLYRFTYIWLDWDSFWFFPVFVGRNSVAGFRWRRNRWVYFGVDLDRVQSFQCY